MRLIASNYAADLPYDRTVIYIKKGLSSNSEKAIDHSYYIYGLCNGEPYRLGEYSSKRRAEIVLKTLHKAYSTGEAWGVIFPTDADLDGIEGLDNDE